MKPARFPGQMGYRRYGTNWTVLNDKGQIAATAEGNPWAFRTRKATVEYLQTHQPAKWLDPVNTDLKHVPKALFSCSNAACREEVSYSAADLFWHIEEQRWICDTCWDYQDFNEEKKISKKGVSLKVWLLAHNFEIKHLL